MDREKPNILFIFTDSNILSIMGCYGNPVVRTPTADKLAREGVRFTNAFTTAPICHPARASISTGLFPTGNGVLTNVIGPNTYPYRIFAEAPRMENLLTEAGYACGYSGQAHLPINCKWTSSRNGLEAFGEWVKKTCPEKGNGYNNLFGAAHYTSEFARDAWNARGAIELMDEFKKLGKPWFIHCDLDHPHAPFTVGSDFDGMYKPEDIPRPANFDDPLTDKPEVQRLTRRREWGDKPQWQDVSQMLAYYYALVSQTDMYVGWLLEKLDKLGEADNTLVVLASDHGELIGAHGLKFKSQVMYDEVMRVPLIARGPAGAKRGATFDGFVSHVDLVPTFAAAAGAPSPEMTHGRSWLGALDGGCDEREDIYAQYNGDGNCYYTLRMVRTRTAKYVWTPYALCELYDLENDPAELTNLAGRPECAALERDMQTRLVRWAKEIGDPAASRMSLMES